MSQYFDLSIRRIEIKKPKRDLKPVIKLQDEVNKTLLHDEYYYPTDERTIQECLDGDYILLGVYNKDKLIAASYRILGLISYLTAGETETRAWTITKGTKAPQAAGKIHSDFERGFIKAEVVYYQDLLDCGSYNGAKEKGLVRMEGKEYVVKDGDVILFRFNV